MQHYLDELYWWTGLAAWLGFALAGWFWLTAWAIDRWLVHTRLRREFFAFYADRLRKRHGNEEISG